MVASHSDGEVLETSATNTSALLAVKFYQVSIFCDVVAKCPSIYRLCHSFGLINGALYDSFIIMY